MAMTLCQIENRRALVCLIVRISEQSNKEMVDHIHNGRSHTQWLCTRMQYNETNRKVRPEREVQ